jgi:LuxR family glucitol operon transcriptional activator
MERVISAVRNTCFAILSGIETDLRDIVGYAALKAGDLEMLPPDSRLAASQRFSLDNRDRPSASPENDLDLLPYTDFADLAKMINLKADLLATEYGLDMRGIAAAVERVAPARNRVCHSRPLQEEDLPDLLDLAKLLLTKYKLLPWSQLSKVQGEIATDPSSVLRLRIPEFWQADTVSIPNNLPYPDFDETTFLGRKTERREVLKHILGPHPIVTIVGEGGVGKTALAIHCLYEILEVPGPRPFDAIVWISLKTRALSASGIAEIRDCITTTLGVIQIAAAKVGIPTAMIEDVNALTSELTEYMEKFRILLVIDNFETISVPPLRPFLSSIPRGSKVLITSRIGLGELEIRYKLDPLDSKTAVILARRFARSLNLEILASASDGRLEKYTAALYRNPLLIKWFVQSVAGGADPEKLAARRGQAFESAIRFCFENLFSRLSPEEKDILHFLAAARRPLTFTELMFLLRQVSHVEQSKLEAALLTLHSSSMLRRTPADPRRLDAPVEITLTDMAAEYISRFAPPDSKVLERVQAAMKRLRELVEKASVQEVIYKFNLYNIQAETRDERISAAYLNLALQCLRAGDIEAALKKVEEAKDLLPTFEEAYRIASLVETKKGDLYKAEEEIKAAIEHSPSSVVARYQYALFLMDSLDDSAQALVEIDAALGLEPQDQTLRTARALILTRLGRCKEAAEIYETVLVDIHLRPRKWRITTKDQAAECYRRYAEQDRLMNDGEALRSHLGRAYDILEEALAGGDYDARTADLYGSVFEDGMFFACQSNDQASALGQVERLSSAIYLLNRIPLRRLALEHVIKIFGPSSEVVSKIGQIKGTVVWARWRAEPPQVDGTPAAKERSRGIVKNVPQGMSYGFIKDEAGQDLFVHKSRLTRPEQWGDFAAGKSVLFVPGTDPQGRRIALDVELL